MNELPDPKRLSDQPLAGFDYNFWFVCESCGVRVCVGSDDYERQSTMQASYPLCKCGVEIDISEASPALRHPDDVALQDALIDKMYWYHSSRYEKWPDTAAYTEDVTNAINEIRFAGVDHQRMVRGRLALALHVGTYEAAIENMLRRICDQDSGDHSTIRYWLHRVQLRLERGDLHPDVGPEFGTLMGDLDLQVVHDRGARAIRYINVHEAVGSISIAIDPGLIVKVEKILLPAAAAAATARATTATDRAIAALTDAEELRPDTSGVSDDALHLAQLFDRPENPSDPHSVRTYDVAKRFEIYTDCLAGIWDELTAVLEAEYLSGVNEQVRRRFLDAVRRHRSRPGTYHEQFRLMAGLLTHAAEICESFDLPGTL
jgi:hypothetical protein